MTFTSTKIKLGKGKTFIVKSNPEDFSDELI